MAIETDADRLAFFSAEDFGVVATITPEGLQPRDVEGIYDAAHLTRGVTQSNGYDNQADASGSKPVFHATSSSLAGIKAGRATVAIPPCPGLPDGGLFSVHDVKADGTGMTILKLMKA